MPTIVSRIFWSLFLASLVTSNSAEQVPLRANILSVCRDIESATSGQSNVYYPGSKEYTTDIYHWSESGVEASTCTVEPTTVEDVGKILRILGESRIPFGVKSGGHATNPGFSSTRGVLIAMYRFNQVAYDPSSQTATIGTGMIFDEVYDALAPYGVSVLGGRVTGIGVGGFVLGGGYAWKTNQHGLAIDSVVAFELVKPDGNVDTISQQSDPELFFGLKGGFNNFGIVTRITMKAYPQTSIYAGTIHYLKHSIPAVSEAVIKFSASNTDPKANIIATYNCLATLPEVSLILYYDAPNPPQGFFQDFLDIPHIASDVGERTLSNFIQKSPSNDTDLLRAIFHTVPLVEYSREIMNVIEDELMSSCDRVILESDPFVSFDVEPFLPNILSHNTGPSAYPPSRDKVYLPLNLYFGWIMPEFDGDIFDVIRQTAGRIQSAAEAEGQDVINAPLYPNYAIFNTPLDKMYGNNVDRLGALKLKIDPTNVMGLAGGFKF